MPTDTIKQAELLRKELPGFKGDAALYWLHPPFKNHRFVVVSALDVIVGGPLCYIFAADKNGGITKKSYKNPLEGSFDGGTSHADALHHIGYEIV